MPVPLKFLQGLRTNLVTVHDSLKHHNTTSTKRTKENAGIDRSKRKKTRTNHQQKRRKRNRLTRKEQKKDKGRNCIMLNRKKKKRKEEQTSNIKKKKGTASRSLVQNTSISLSMNVWVRKKGFKLIIMVKALVLNDKGFSRRIKLVIIKNK